ncbi:YheC/YheD family protein [Microbacteriaceae bacterium 4G12]
MRIFSIDIHEDDANVILLPYVFHSVKELRAISFGTKVINCEVQTNYISDCTVLISKEIQEALQLPFLQDTHIFIHEDTIIIGPLIGIFTAGFTDSLSQPTGDRSLFFANLLTASDINKAFLFVFGSQHINWEDGTISGYFYHKQRWLQTEIPFPNVVYDRLPNRRIENHRAIVRVKSRLLTEYMIPWFNPGFFNKWDIYQSLQHEEAASPYLPETQQFINFEQVEFMLSRYGHVYIKPMNGSLGSGIYQVRYSFEENTYYCRYRDESGNKLRKYHSLEYLVNHLLSQYDLDTFIVQQGISLLRINGQPVDFRIHTNKDRQGKWKVSVMAAKIAGQGSMTTHINNGGDVKTMEEIFPDSVEREEISHQLTSAILLLSECIDRRVEGSIGEIGFDVGLDKDKKIWLFEANSKPGRAIFEHPKLQESDRLTKELFLEYALYLTEQSLLRPEELFQ